MNELNFVRCVISAYVAYYNIYQKIKLDSYTTHMVGGYTNVVIFYLEYDGSENYWHFRFNGVVEKSTILEALDQINSLIGQQR